MGEKQVRFKVKHQPKSTRAEKVHFILKYFPEILHVKNPRLEVAKITKIKLAMFEHGLYSNTYDRASASADAAILKIVEFMQAQRLTNKKDIDTSATLVEA
jgi:hypothetical protein